MAYVPYNSRCKVCKSQLKDLIHELYKSGMSPEKIYEYLHNLEDPKIVKIVETEDISAAGIRRHLTHHFNTEEDSSIKLAETKAKLSKHTSAYSQGLSIVVDKISALNYLIDKDIILIEELQNKNESSARTKYTSIAQLSNVVRGMIETVSKLTGDLKQEGTVDINFFNMQLSDFADLVIRCIYDLDKQYNMNGKLYEAFLKEFKNEWKLKQQTLDKLSLNDGTLKEV